jgi:hypothetical protein
MSVNGDSTANPTPENVKQWVYAIQNPTEIKSLVFDFNGLSSGFDKDKLNGQNFDNAVYNPSVKFMLPKESQITAPSGNYCRLAGATTDGTRYWCYDKYKEVTDTSSSSEPQTELVCVAENSGNNFIPAGTKLVNGVITLSCKAECITTSAITSCTIPGFMGGVK